MKKNKKIRLPNWVKIYNKFFNFSLNFQELFNFSLNSTNINNDSGLTYIRGLRASSLFLLIVGLTFQVFMNCMSKIFSRTLFYEFLKNTFYSFFFIIGVTIISIGYKFKLRIDYFILILIII